jgi:hypothetical protein
LLAKKSSVFDFFEGPCLSGKPGALRGRRKKAIAVGRAKLKISA